MLVLQSVKGYKIFICSNNDAGRRLDRVLKKMLPDLPAGLIYSGLRKGLIKVNGSRSTQSARIENGDEIWVKERLCAGSGARLSASSADEGGDREATEMLKELTILRTDNLLLLNKPAGMLTHGENSLARLVDRGLTGVEPSLSFRPAPLHRLDRNTSGIVTVSLSIEGAARFSELMRGRQLSKHYLGLCIDGPSSRIRLENSLDRRGGVTSALDLSDAGGLKTGITTAEPVLTSGRFRLTLFNIETGLTHQIRAQSAAAGFPLAGDIKYGGGLKGCRRFFLHAFSLSLTGYDEVCGFKDCSAEPPPAFMNKAASIFGADRVENALNRLKTDKF